MPNIILLENGTSGVLTEDGAGFVMEELGADITGPTVTITEPAAGATISGATNPFTATATDNVAVRGIKFYLDNVLIGTEDTTSPYSVNIDATALSAGTHTLKAVAFDTAGNASAEATRSVTVAAAATAAIWEAGRIFDIDADNNTAANGALSVSTPSTVDSTNYRATDVSGIEGTMFTNKINGHKAVYYPSAKGASIPALPTGLTSFSIGLVANQDTGQEAAGTRIISANLNWLISFTRNGLQFYTGATVAGDNPSTISGGVAHVALAEISPSGAAFYVDGVLIGSATGTFSIPAQIFLGRSNGGFGEPAIAYIARTVTWNKTLSATERAAWFADMKAIYGIA